MKIRRLLLVLAMFVSLVSCDNRMEDPYEYIALPIGIEEGFNPFTFGNVRLQVDNHMKIYNAGSDVAEMAFSKNFVYRIQMINKIPRDGWSDTADCVLQNGYVGRLMKDDGTYEYCRFYVFTIDYDATATQFALIKYSRDFRP